MSCRLTFDLEEGIKNVDWEWDDGGVYNGGGCWKGPGWT